MVVLDAAMGTRLLRRGLDLATEDPALWNLSCPDAVVDAHERDLRAGSEAILTNTFGANRLWLERYGRAADTVAINRAAVRIAREAQGPGRAIIGSVGPTTVLRHDHTPLVEQVEALVGAGVDAILLETFEVAPAIRAVEILLPELERPVIVSLLDWPDDAEVWAGVFKKLGVSALGANCQASFDEAIRCAERLREATDLPIWLKPGGGIPGGQKWSPEDFQAAVPRLKAAGVTFVGGCCGTSEEHIAALRAGVRQSRWP